MDNLYYNKAVGVLILGCHRSGTSVVSGLLHYSGVHMTDVIAADYANPKGYFENKDIQTINRKVLKYFNTTWKNPPPVKKIEACSAFDDIVRTTYLSYRNKYAKFGWKDPRLCITFPIWNTVNDWKIIICLRKPGAVADSLCRKPYKLSHSAGLVIWEQYNKRIAYYLNQYIATCHLVEYETLIANPGVEYSKLCKFLGLDRSNKALNFVDKNLSHHNYNIVPNKLVNLYKKIKRSC